MSSWIRNFFSLNSKKFTAIRRIQILFFVLVFLLNFTFLSLRNVEIYIHNFLTPLAFIAKILNKKIYNISNAITVISDLNNLENLKKENLLLKNKLLEYQDIKNNELTKHNRQDNFIFLDRIKIISIVRNSEKYITAKYFKELDLNINDLIVNEEKFLVGRIIAINKNLQVIKVQLVEDSNFYIPIYSKETRFSGILSSKKDKNCSLEFFSFNKKLSLNEGEFILTSGEDNLITSDIKIGHIEKHNQKNCVKRDIDLIKNDLFIIRNIFSNYKWD